MRLLFFVTILCEAAVVLVSRPVSAVVGEFLKPIEILTSDEFVSSFTRVTGPEWVTLQASKQGVSISGTPTEAGNFFLTIEVCTLNCVRMTIYLSVSGTSLCVFGGMDASGNSLQQAECLDTRFSRDPRVNFTWVNVSLPPVALKEHAVVYWKEQDAICISGGYTMPSTTVSDAIHCTSGSLTRPWQTLSLRIDPRHDHSAVIFQGALCLLGGSFGETYASTIPQSTAQCLASIGAPRLTSLPNITPSRGRTVNSWVDSAGQETLCSVGGHNISLVTGTDPLLTLAYLQGVECLLKGVWTPIIAEGFVSRAYHSTAVSGSALCVAGGATETCGNCLVTIQCFSWNKPYTWSPIEARLLELSVNRVQASFVVLGSNFCLAGGGQRSISPTPLTDAVGCSVSGGLDPAFEQMNLPALTSPRFGLAMISTMWNNGLCKVTYDSPFGALSNRSCPYLLSDRSRCAIGCVAPFHLVTDASVTCRNGVLVWPLANESCKLQPKGSDPNVRMSLVLEIDTNNTSCRGQQLDLADPGTQREVMESFMAHVRQLLAMRTEQLALVSVMQVNESSLNATMVFRASRTKSAADYINDFFVLKSQPNSTLTQFDFSGKNQGICAIYVVIKHISLSFATLFSLLINNGLPLEYLVGIMAALLGGIIFFLVLNRHSLHPFAIIGATVSIFSTGSKCYFIQFLSETTDLLKTDGLESSFFARAFLAALTILILTIIFNFIATVWLFCKHVSKNTAAFKEWGTRHKFAIVVVFLLCGLNPASLLVLCSGTFNKDVFNGPFSFQAQQGFQASGLFSVLISDLPFLGLQIATLIEVRDNVSLSWETSSNSIILTLVISVASLVVSIVRRCVSIYRPIPKKLAADVGSSLDDVGS